MNMLDKLQAHVALARKTDLVYQKAKKSHDKNWIKEAVEAMELQLDSDFVRCVQGYVDAPRRTTDD